MARIPNQSDLHMMPTSAYGTARFLSRWMRLVSSAIVLAGCASLTPEQCMHADWRRIGFADGTQGLPGARIEDHAKACAAQGIRLNLDEYLKGRAQGLYSYCQPENGFTVGRRGNEHNAADCPDYMKQAFLYQYQRGHLIYDIESELSRQRSHIDRNYRRIRHDDERISEIRDDLKKSDLPAERRTELLNEFNRLVEEKDALSRENAYLRNESERLQMHLSMKLREFGR